MQFTYHVDEHITLELQSPFHASELLQLVINNRDYIGQYLSWAQRIETLHDMQHYLRRDLMGMAHERRWAWLIRYDGQVAGRIGLFVTVPALQECELYYFLGESFTGRGIVTRVAQVIIDYAVHVLRMKHLLIGFNPDNMRSGAVARRLGFQYEYTLHDAELHGEGWRSLHFWGILADAWQAKERPTFSYMLDHDITLQLYQPHQSTEKYRLLRNNQAEFSQWFWWANDDFTLSKEREIARRLLKRYLKQSGLGVTIWDGHQMIGNSSLSIDVDRNHANIGYWLDRNARGRGIMTRAVLALLEDAFSTYDVERVRILAAAGNTGSRALAERIGFMHELYQKDEALIGGQFVDHVQYSLLRDEWKAKYHDLSSDNRN